MVTDGTVTLAPFERDDLARVLEWVNDAELCRAVDRVLPVTRLEHERWYEALVTQRDSVTFAIQVEGETIGLCGLAHQRPRQRRATLWIYIGPAAQRGRGYGERSVRLLLRFGFEQLNLHRIHLFTPAYNIAAQKTYLKCGFREEGRDRDHIFIDGRYHDDVRMGILDSEYAPSEE